MSPLPCPRCRRIPEPHEPHYRTTTVSCRDCNESYPGICTDLRLTRPEREQVAIALWNDWVLDECDAASLPRYRLQLAEELHHEAQQLNLAGSTPDTMTAVVLSRFLLDEAWSDWLMGRIAA